MKSDIIIVFSILIGFSACGLLPGEDEIKDSRRKKDLKRTLVAQNENGGEEFIAEMSAVLNARKFTRYLEEDVNYAVDMYDSEFLIIIDSLNCQEEEWRTRHFDVINQIYHIETLHKFYPKMEDLIFSRFLSHPKEIINKMSELEFNDSDFWTERLSKRLKEVTSDSTITEISVTNLALDNCNDCADTDEKDIANFVSFLSKM